MPVSDTILIDGISYNETALKSWNFTAYSNGTLSNGSSCFLTFGPFKPVLISPNGTFVNTTSCYAPVNPIGARGITGLAFGCLFALSILFSTINLRKHGRAYLPPDKRWKPAGRRWPWYWCLIVAVCGILSSFPAVDVDRDYVVNLPMILQCFFITLTGPALMACVWEAARSWNSSCRRQIEHIERNAAPRDRLLETLYFYLPLILYGLVGMFFFLLIPRSWSFVEKQRSDIQTIESAKHTALDARFKAGSILAAACLGLTLFHLIHGSRIHRFRIPATLLVITILAAARNAYMIVGSWVWDVSPYRLEGSIGLLYGLGYAPVLSIIALLNIRGYVNENEDKVLIAERAFRDDNSIDGVQDGRNVRKRRNPAFRDGPPSWWFKSRSAAASSSRSIFEVPLHTMTKDPKHNVRGNPASADDPRDHSGYHWWQQRKQGEEDTRHRKARYATTTGGSNPDTSSDAGMGSRWTERSESILLPSYSRDPYTPSIAGESDQVYNRGGLSHSASSATSLQAAPQTVKSMLDV